MNDGEKRRSTSYKCLKSKDFDKCYKNVSPQLNLLAILREQLDVKAAKAVYECMILPTST